MEMAMGLQIQLGSFSFRVGTGGAGWVAEGGLEN